MTQVLVALSLAHWCHLRLVLNTTYKRYYRYYVEKGVPSRIRLLALILSISILSSVIWVSLKIGELFDGSVQDGISLTVYLLCCIPISLGIVALASRHVKETKRLAMQYLGKITTVILSCVILVSAVGAIVLWPSGVSRLISILLVWTSPLLLVTAVLILTSLVRSRNLEDFRVLANADYSKKRLPVSSRVVVLIFDELDQRLTFDERPNSIALPHFDSLVKTSTVCTKAVPPCRCTEISMPAFLCGTLFNEAVIERPSQLRMYPRFGQDAQLWTSHENLFSRLKEKGFNAAMTTWYHPIDRLFGDQLVKSRWYEAPNQENSLGSTLSQNLFWGLRSLLETPSFSPFGQSLVVKKAISSYQGSLRDALEFVADDSLHLSVIHWTIPHGPYIYDHQANDFSLANSSPIGYLGNLVLSDISLGKVRSIMEQIGTWEGSAVIVTSDHWWRYSDGFDGKKDLRVPFIVKLPGQTESVTYERPFNTVLLHDLVVNLLTEKAMATSQMKDWLMSHGFDAPPTKI